MPGLFGYWSRNPINEPPKWLNDMGISMQHQAGLKIEVEKYPGFSAGRVHLGVFQPTSQPVLDDSQRYALWLDGEFNNVPDLQRMLDWQDQVDVSDADLALALFLQVGWDFLSEADGLFAIVVYDRHAHELTIVSDRYGLHPLYWIETADGFGYAGEVKALLKIPEVNTRIDLLAVQEWFSFGYLLGNRTWIDGVELFPPATIMQISAQEIKSEQYWSWQSIALLSSDTDEAEIVDELGRLWLQAIKRRTDERRLGQLLSGGLDSRAILAALPETKYQYHTVTFGRSGCEDERIARAVSKFKEVPHHFVEIDATNWLLPAIEGIWRTDGMGRIFDLHGVEAIAQLKEYCDVQLHGFLGDAVVGGSYLGLAEVSSYLHQKIIANGGSSLQMPNALPYLRDIYSHTRLPLDRFLVNQRGRRFINTGIILASSWIETRRPFFDKDFLAFVFSIPDYLRANSYIYNRMLLQCFPDFYRSIPWQKSGLPISASRPRQILRDRLRLAENLSRSVVSKLGFTLPSNRRNYTDYPLWVRSEPARGLISKLLMSENSFYVDFLDPTQARSIVVSFMETKDNRHLHTIGLLLTFEVFLRQLATNNKGVWNGEVYCSA